MKKFTLLLGVALLYTCSVFSQALTVTATPVNSTVCAGNSTAITANTTPVGYALSAISYNQIPSPGPGATNYLADAGVALVTPTQGVNLDDCRWDNISLPFTFNFYGVDYTSINISSNGWVAMGSTTPSVTTGFNVALANTGLPNSVIHLVTADLDLRTASGGTLEYFEDGSFPNRTFVILYTNAKFLSATGTVTVEAILKEGSNEVEIHTTSCTNTTKNKAQGVENATGTLATVATGRNNTTTWTGTPNAFKFTPDQFTYAWSPSATLSSATGKTVTATPTGNTTYTVTSTRVSDNATATSTVTININPASYTLASTPAPGGNVIFQNTNVLAGGTDFRDGNCNLIARVVPAGASPVSNLIRTAVRLDTGATKKGTADLYAARNYDIEPQINPSTSTANVTLYFLQSEFDKFNLRATDSGHNKLPTGPGDATGISNLIIRQFHGTGTLPANYTSGLHDDFNTPAAGFSVVWNASRNWWEITVPVNGFSGFYLTSKKSAPVPIKLEYFKGSHTGNNNLLDWKVNCTSTEAKFDIERSLDARNFTSIYNFTAPQVRCLQPFDYTDTKPASGINYYRIKMTDVDGKASYSAVVALLNKETGFELVSMQPTLVKDGTAALMVTAAQKTNVQIVITDVAGKKVQAMNQTLNNGSATIMMNVEKLSPGTYQVTGYTVNGRSRTIRFVKQ